MYTPPIFHENDPAELSRLIRESGLSTLVTATPEGIMATPLPLILVETEGDRGTLYGHLAKANPQWSIPAIGEAMAIFNGPHAYVTPSWYPSKQEHGKVVPTWNYIAIHAYGFAEFFSDEERLYDAVSRLTQHHEAAREQPWAVTDAPQPFIQSQLKGIIGLKFTITRIEGKVKMSQNRPQPDRQGVQAGLANSLNPNDIAAAQRIPL